MTETTEHAIGGAVVMVTAMLLPIALGHFFPGMMVPFERVDAATESMALGDRETAPWDVPGLDTDRAAYFIEESREEGKEHGFYFCVEPGGGPMGPGVEGTNGSIPDWQRMRIDCGDAGGGIFHTHPGNGSEAARLSTNDTLIARNSDDVDVVCAGSFTGHIGCYWSDGTWMRTNVTV